MKKYLKGIILVEATGRDNPAHVAHQPHII